MKKIRVNMLSMATSVDGQGVGSAYVELVDLIREMGKDEFEVSINGKVKSSDILHIHTVEPRNFLKMKFTKKPTVMYVHFLPTTLDGSIKIPRFAFWIFKWYVMKMYKSADHLVVVNPTFKKEMVKNGLDAEKITYIPNFVSKEKFYKDKQAGEAARKKYGISAGKFVVLGCGQVQTRKGVMDFVRTAEKLPEVQFVWAGGFSFGAITDGHTELQKVMENPPENVKFIGIVPREKMNAVFNIADLLFIPSFNELFPMTILEAANTETPILTRNLELYEEILMGNYEKAENVEGFKRAIEKFEEDEEYYKRGVEGAKRIAEFYSKERVYRMWKEYYCKIYRGVI